MELIKRILIFTSISVILLGCEETMEVRSAKGSYSFKTSGKAELGNLDREDKTIELENESGQLEIISLHNEENVMLTFNQINGGVYSTKGTIKDDILEIEPYTRTYTITSTITIYDTIHTTIGGILNVDSISSHEKIIHEIYDIEVSGNGTIYDNSIIFTLKYDGKSDSSERTLKSENIQMIAKKN